ncbi:MAG: mechanosensitive ion channel family protein [Planctomycetota bacterium]|jgi:MscS family membrane protein
MAKKLISIIPAAILFFHKSNIAAESSSTLSKYNFLDNKILGYTVVQLGSAALVLIVALVITTVFRFLLKKRQESEDAKETGDRKSILGLIINSGQKPLQIVIWSIAINILGLVFKVGRNQTLWTTNLLYSIAIALFIYNLVDIVEYFFGRIAEKTDNKLDDMLVPVVRKALKVLVIIVASLQIYNAATGQSITTLLAGLGLGGLAFALAAQDTLKNLFGFAMILTDRPFNIGERINIAGHDGTVETVGFRSVRVRRLDGHQVIIPNSKVADDVIHNIGRRPFIKRVMNVSVTYDTPPEKVEKAVNILREILENHEGMDPEFPPRVYFNDMLADSLNILAIYWYFPPEYWNYLDLAQRINLELMKRYEEEGIEFAFPTQTLYLAGDPETKNANLFLTTLTSRYKYYYDKILKTHNSYCRRQTEFYENCANSACT